MSTPLTYSPDDDDADQGGDQQSFDWSQHGFQLDTGNIDAWLNDDDDDPPPLGIRIVRYDSGTRTRCLMKSDWTITPAACPVALLSRTNDAQCAGARSM